MRKLLLALLMTALLLLGCTEEPASAPAQPSETTQPAAAADPTQNTVVEEVDVVTVPKTEWIVTAEEGMPDIDVLTGMTSLKRLDLTALPYTSFSEIEALMQALPNCRIIWNQKLTDGAFSSESESLTLPNATAEDIDLLKVFFGLRAVDATGSTEYSALAAFAEAHPDIAVRYAFRDGSFVLTSEDETATVPADVDADALTDAVPSFPNLRSIDLRYAGWTDAQIDAFCSANPLLSVGRTVQIGNLRFDSDTEAMNLHALSGWTPDALLEKLRAFPNLNAVGLPADWSEQEIASLKSALPNVRVAGKLQRFGIEIDGAAEELDLSGTKIGDVSDAEALIADMPFLKKLILCNCGLGDEQMAALADGHPEIRFVWIITIGPHKLRTDAIGFSTKNPSKYTNPKASEAYNKKVKNTKRLHEGDIELLKYCYDLEALDLGHNYLTNQDLLVISGLTKLKVLILADNSITDISCLTTLKDLEYIELFMNRIPDLTPLTEMPSLVDVNVCNVGASDLTPLFSLTGAKRLWYAMNPFSRDQAAAVKEALPDCVCNYTTRDETGEGWRESERYKWMRAYFD